MNAAIQGQNLPLGRSSRSSWPNAHAWSKDAPASETSLLLPCATLVSRANIPLLGQADGMEIVDLNKAHRGFLPTFSSTAIGQPACTNCIGFMNYVTA